MAADPTMQFLAELDDPSKWHVVHNVPVTRPHKLQMKGSDGKKRTVEVTEQDLTGIASTVNAAYQSAGVPIRVTIGHIKHDPDAEETEQPILTGYARDAKVGTFGPGKVPGVLVDLYLRKESARQVLAQHPFRSMEFDVEDKRIRGIALLTRDPMLDLGVVTYSGNKWIVNYDSEGSKKEKPDKGSPGKKESDDMPGEDVGAVTADTGTDKDNDPLIVDGEKPEGGTNENPLGEDAEYAGFCKLMQRYIASGGLSAMGPMGGLMPQAQMIPAAGEAPAKYQRDTTVSKEIDTEVAALKSQVAAMKRERDEEAAKRLLDPLKEAVKFNYAKEQATLVSLPDDKARVEHVQYMKENYAPLLESRIGGHLIRTRDVPVPLPKQPKGADEAIFEEPDRYPEIMGYMRANPGMQYELAEAKVMEKYATTK